MNLSISLDRIVSAIGNVARPYVLYSAATSSALATVSIVWMKADLMAGAAFVGAAWGGVALLYGAKAMENASVAKTNAAPPPSPDAGQLAQ
jgi:hypothetical protein